MIYQLKGQMIYKQLSVYSGCPHGLAVYIARAAYHRIRELDYQCFCDDSQLEDGPSGQPRRMREWFYW